MAMKSWVASLRQFRAIKFFEFVKQVMNSLYIWNSSCVEYFVKLIVGLSNLILGTGFHR